MSGTEMYWLNDSAAPFATFLSIIQTYYHPEVRNQHYGWLVERAQEARSEDAEMVTFKKELTQLLQGRREGLRPGAIDVAAAYDEWDTDEEFLTWLWHDLYPNEPVPTPPADGPREEL